MCHIIITEVVFTTIVAVAVIIVIFQLLYNQVKSVVSLPLSFVAEPQSSLFGPGVST